MVLLTLPNWNEKKKNILKCHTNWYNLFIIYVYLHKFVLYYFNIITKCKNMLF